MFVVILGGLCTGVQRVVGPFATEDDAFAAFDGWECDLLVMQVDNLDTRCPGCGSWGVTENHEVCGQCRN